MKAPDKIFVHLFPHTEPQLVDENYVGNAYSVPYDDHEPSAYIRKEALLEWAKEVHNSGPIKDSADKGDAWSIGYLCGMKDMIDKLNSM